MAMELGCYWQRLKSNIIFNARSHKVAIALIELVAWKVPDYLTATITLFIGGGGFGIGYGVAKK